MLRVLFWPFRMMWSFVGILFLGLGKLITFILGLTLLGVGIALCCTLIGAIVGIPLIAVGGTMALRSFF